MSTAAITPDPYAAYGGAVASGGGADPYASYGGKAIIPIPPSQTAQPEGLWQKMKDNFNANTQGAQPGDGVIKSALENFGAGGGDMIRSVGQAVMHPIDTLSALAQPSPYKTPQQELADSVNQVKTMVHNPARTLGQLGTGTLLGEGAGEAIGAGAEALPSLPSRANAASVFNDLNTKLADQPVPLSDTLAPLQRATEIGVRGGSLPKPISDLLTRSQATEPMTFPEARDYQMSLTDLSREQQASLTPRMRSQVAQVNQGLFNDIHAAAESAQPGLGSDFADAMKEYRQASQVKNAIDAAKKIALPVAATAIAGASGGLALRYLSEIGK